MDKVYIFDILFDFFEVLMQLTVNAYNFLFYPIKIPLLNFEIQLFFVLGGAGFTALMIAWIIRRFI